MKHVLQHTLKQDNQVANMEVVLMLNLYPAICDSIANVIILHLDHESRQLL